LNPFNGIERHVLSVLHEMAERLNPFNGIERKPSDWDRVEECVEIMNPFNGIERLDITVIIV